MTQFSYNHVKTPTADITCCRIWTTVINSELPSFSHAKDMIEGTSKQEYLGKF